MNYTAFSMWDMNSRTPEQKIKDLRERMLDGEAAYRAECKAQNIDPELPEKMVIINSRAYRCSVELEAEVKHLLELCGSVLIWILSGMFHKPTLAVRNTLSGRQNAN